MSRKHNESGELLIAVLIGVSLVSALVALAVAQKMALDSNKSSQTIEQRTAAVIAANGTRAFIGPQPPAGLDDKCSIDAAREANIAWTNDFGWREINVGSGNKEPLIQAYVKGQPNDPSGAEAAYRNAFNAWYGRMEADVQKAQDGWKLCADAAKAAPGPEQQQVFEIAGTYHLELRNPTGNECDKALPQTMTATRIHNFEQVSDIQFHDVANHHDYTVIITPVHGYHFSMAWDEGQYNIHYTASGQFLLENGKVIVEGVFTTSVAGTCSVAFLGSQ